MDMTRPAEKDIWNVLNDTASEETSAKVAEWFSGEEGQTWLSENSDLIFRLVENGKLKSASPIPSEEMLDLIHDRIRRIQKKKKFKSYLWRAAAVIIPLLAITLAWYDVSSMLGGGLLSENRTVSESTVLGEKKILVFQDGTKIHMNSEAVVKYPEHWGLRKREIALEGEAYFEVSKDSRRPFTVDIYGTVIKVTGTSFNVKAYPDDDLIDIVLTDGAITFEAEDREYALKPSERLTYSKSDKSVNISTMSHPDNASIWTKNILMFRNDSLQDVTEILGRWYGIRFIITDDSLLSRTFTFKTIQIPVRELLDEMEYISDLRFEMKGDTVIVSKK